MTHLYLSAEDREALAELAAELEIEHDKTDWTEEDHREYEQVERPRDLARVKAIRAALSHNPEEERNG